MPKDAVAPESLRELGPYQLSTVLGRGGMGTVYLGVERESGREVAVKVLAPAFASEDGFRARFESEIQSMEKLRHPNIVALFGYGEQDGNLFYAMELVRGSSLHDELAAGRRFQWREVVRIGIDICKALRHAHDHGIIHRDIKPANLLLSDDDAIKLTDFGIAKLFGQTSLTVAGGVVGTADYMAPEQAQGLPVTPRTDLYSTGCLLYALLAGRPPFDGASVATVIHKVQYDTPIPVGRLVTEVPEALEALIDRLLEKEPSKRVPTAQSLAKRLEDIEKKMQLGPTPRSVTDVVGEHADSAATLDQTAHDESALAAAGDDVDAEDCPTVAQSREQFLSGSASGVHSSPTLAQAETASPEPRRTSHARTYVSVEDRDAANTIDRSESWMNRALIALLVAVCIGGMGWGLLRLIAPPNADELYDRLERAADKGDAALADERSEISLFLQQHAADSRVNQVRQWRTQVEMHRLQAAIERSIHRRARTPVQEAMRNAIRIERTDPDQALDILKGLVLAYQSDEALTRRDQQCLELAERKIVDMELGRDATHKLERAWLRERYEYAIVQPADEAAPILEGLLLLHAASPWAKDELEQIRTELAELRNKLQGAAADPSS